MDNILVIHGAGRLSEIVAEFATLKYSHIFRYVDKNFLDSPLTNFTSTLLPIITDLSSLKNIPTVDYISTVGYKNMQARQRVYDWALTIDNFSPTNIIHEAAFIAPDAKLGMGNIIFPGVVIEPGVSIGSNNIIWSNTTICHDATIGNHNFIASSSVIGGYAQIGHSCFFGFGSIVNDSLKLRDHIFLASGTVVITDQTTSDIALCGVPARIMRHS